MLVTLLPIVTLVRPAQPENAQSPMLVTLSRIVTLVRLFAVGENVAGDLLHAFAKHNLHSDRSGADS